MDKLVLIQSLIILLTGSKILGCSRTKRLLDYTDYIKSVYPTCVSTCDQNRPFYDWDGKCNEKCFVQAMKQCAVTTTAYSVGVVVNGVAISQYPDCASRCASEVEDVIACKEMCLIAELKSCGVFPVCRKSKCQG
ncbi:hypothetical protein CRM22_002023 [Opisthorchis felineus]|uniref:Uncharacterized protein n=1 Tax=Opisthorchis felineus TaxID=147828 RepID=A0A4S2MEF8_OPIFE|nr:hypothetical protein CRM22_002023 [Opisthorchis felineus]